MVALTSKSKRGRRVYYEQLLDKVRSKLIDVFGCQAIVEKYPITLNPVNNQLPRKKFLCEFAIFNDCGEIIAFVCPRSREGINPRLKVQLLAIDALNYNAFRRLIVVTDDPVKLFPNYHTIGLKDLPNYLNKLNAEDNLLIG